MLGAARLAIGGGPEHIDTVDEAMMWANCFGQRAHIAENVTVGIGEIDAGSSLKFTATGPVKIKVDVATLGKVERATATLTKGSLIRVEKSSGPFELASPHGQRILVRKDDISGLLDGSVKRFAAASDTTYEIRTKDDSTAVDVAGEGDQQKVTLRPGATGSLSLATSQALTTLEPLDDKPWLLGAGTIIQFVSATAGSGLDQVIIQAKRQGGQSNGDTTLLACAHSPAIERPQLIGAAMSPPGADTGTVSMLIPGSFLSKFPQFIGSVGFALVSPGGKYAAVGSYTAVDRIWSAAISLAFTVVIPPRVRSQ